MTEKICPVCNRKVGEWHTDGVHPSCRPKLRQLADERGIGARLSQRQRDDILGRINRR